MDWIRIFRPPARACRPWCAIIGRLPGRGSSSWQSGDKEAFPERRNRMDGMYDGTGCHTQPAALYTIYPAQNLSLPDQIRHPAGFFPWAMAASMVSRASVASSFHWYDLEKEEKTTLRLFPFCFMDANSFYEQHDTPAQAMRELMHYYHLIRKQAD